MSTWAQTIAAENNARVLAGIMQAAADARARAAADTVRNTISLPPLPTGEANVAPLLNPSAVITSPAPLSPVAYVVTESTMAARPQLTDYDDDRSRKESMAGENGGRLGRKKSEWRKWDKGLQEKAKPKAKKRSRKK